MSSEDRENRYPGAVPETEPERQYYFIRECREIVKTLTHNGRIQYEYVFNQAGHQYRRREKRQGGHTGADQLLTILPG